MAEMHTCFAGALRFSPRVCTARLGNLNSGLGRELTRCARRLLTSRWCRAAAPSPAGATGTAQKEQGTNLGSPSPAETSGCGGAEG